jgi:thiamine-phosphate pyrophosphorylase
MSSAREERARRFAGVDLYPVTGAEHSAGRTTIQIVEAVRAAGCRVVQLREKELSKADYFELALAVRGITSEAGMLMICNDHLDVALSVGADGVHLGDDDLPLAAARALAPELIIGASTHSLEQALAAESAGADYVNIGPIFPTSTKQSAARFLGPDAVERIAPHLSSPFTVMGGIKLDNVDQLLRAGARRIAVVTAVTAAEDPRAAAEALRQRIVTADQRSKSSA